MQVGYHLELMDPFFSVVWSIYQCSSKILTPRKRNKKKSPHHTRIFHVQFIPAIKSNLITEQGVKSMFVLVASLKCTNSRRNTFLTHLTIPIEPYLVPYSICTCKNNLLYHLTLSFICYGTVIVLHVALWYILHNTLQNTSQFFFL